MEVALKLGILLILAVAYVVCYVARQKYQAQEHVAFYPLQIEIERLKAAKDMPGDGID